MKTIETTVIGNSFITTYKVQYQTEVERSDIQRVIAELLNNGAEEFHIKKTEAIGYKITAYKMARPHEQIVGVDVAYSDSDRTAETPI